MVGHSIASSGKTKFEEQPFTFSHLYYAAVVFSAE
jgi:hypothetical protein